MSVRFSVSFAIFILLLSGMPGVIHADLATIYLKDGQARTVELVSAERGQVRWRSSAAATEEQATLRSQIDFVAFPTTGAWREAEDAFESGRIPQAVTKYRLVIADQLAHFYPVPGNFVSLAQERLLRCFRRQMDVAAIAKQAELVRGEFLNLPPELRVVPPEVEAWKALAKGLSEKVLAALAEVENPTPETFYLRGRAFEASGKTEEAIQAYAGTYVLNFGGPLNYTREALQRSASLLNKLADSDRKAELQAQVKIYRDLFGVGKLWGDAPETLVLLADGKIESIGGAAEGDMEKPGSKSGGVVASTSGTAATAAPLGERDYILPEELPERVIYVGGDAEASVKGGMKEADGYAFDGTGGKVVISPIDASHPSMNIRVRFKPETENGVIADANVPRRGGFGIYLKEGEIVVVWHRFKGKLRSWNVGKAPVGETTNLLLGCSAGGNCNIVVGREKRTEEIEKGGLALGKGLTVVLGTTGDGGNKGAADGGSHPSFKGKIHHFSISSGANYNAFKEKEIEKFGKRIVLLPPVPNPEEGEEEKPEEDEAKEESKEKPKE